MKISTQPYKGTRDFYPEDYARRQYIFDTWSRAMERFGYQPYDGPIIEPIDLYRSKTSQEIVDQQLYSFVDRGDREVAIRPEMTPTVARMVAARRQELAYPLRLYSIPNLWRYERPQKGRLREHWQLNGDIFGVESIQAEQELILLAHGLMSDFGAREDMYKIRINSRKLINVLLEEYFTVNPEQITEVIRLIDKIDKLDKRAFKDAMSDLVGERADEIIEMIGLDSLEGLPDSVAQFAGPLNELVSSLTKQQVGNLEIDLSLMRGFDYYTDIVFEVFDTHPDNSRSMFGGGRYDGLVGKYGVHDLPAAGFAAGDVTMAEFLTGHELWPKGAARPGVYLAVVGAEHDRAQLVAQQLRTDGLIAELDLSGRKLDQQIKAAVAKGYRYVLFVGEQELRQKKFVLKDLQTTKSQTLELDKVIKAVL